MDTSLELKDEQVFSAQIELLIKILANQEVIAGILIERLSESDEDAERLNKIYNEEYNKAAKRILQDLYTRRGHIDLNNLIK